MGTSGNGGRSENLHRASLYLGLLCPGDPSGVSGSWPEMAEEKQQRLPHTQLFHSSTRPWFAHHSPITQTCKPDATEPRQKQHT